MDKLLIIDCGTKHLKEIEEITLPYFKEFEVISIVNFDGNIKSDFVIISGGSNTRSIMRHSEEFESTINYIKNSDTPILGICFGCELIAKAFGCTISDSGFKRVEMQEICFDDKNFCIPAFEAHRFFIDKVSDEIEILAHGKDNSIEVIKHKNKKIIGAQFHPEVSQEKSEIFEYLLNLMK